MLRLLALGFVLVADDQVVIEAGWAAPPEVLAGLLEVRGLGIVRLPHTAPARLSLVVRLGTGDRLPNAATHAETGLPMVHVDASQASATARVSLALDCALGVVTQQAGAFAAPMPLMCPTSA